MKLTILWEKSKGFTNAQMSVLVEDVTFGLSSDLQESTESCVGCMGYSSVTE